MAVETRQRVTVPIKGMTCASCVSQVSNALTGVRLKTFKPSMD